jgi:hypothetical protein
MGAKMGIINYDTLAWNFANLYMTDEKCCTSVLLGR